MKVRYLVTKGNIGLYDTNLEAFNNTKDYNQGSILPIPMCSRSIDVCLCKALKDFIDSGGTIDIHKLEHLFDSPTKYTQIKKKYEQSKFCIAYINRLVNDNGTSQYGILIENNNRVYVHKSLLVTKRGANTDIAPFQKLRELCNLYDFRGIVRVMYPLPTVKYWDYSTRWKVEKLVPIELPFGMRNLNLILSGQDSIIPVFYI